MQSVILKPGKDKPIANRHHWIFSGAIKSLPEFEDDDILPVETANGEFLGYAYFNSKTSISGRMLSFDKTPAEEAIKQNIDKAIAFRDKIFDRKITNAYRLVNSEGDKIPGLVIDLYNDVLVLQIATLGIERLKPMIVEHLIKSLKSRGTTRDPDFTSGPKTIYEKSNLLSRGEEGLQNQEGLLYGEDIDEVEIMENKIKFIVSLKNGQKTGFFLDQREMRKLVGELSEGKKVLNCFGYTGGFSLYAMNGGATTVDTVDISEDAINLAKKNTSLNKIKTEKHGFIAEDVFQFLREKPLEYNLIILDPPAFTKRKTDIIQACRGYKDINRLAIKKILPNSFLLTSSCSYHVDEKLFQTVVFQAAAEANRSARIIGRHRLAPDHPINIFHPEGEYLKSLLLFIE